MIRTWRYDVHASRPKIPDGKHRASFSAFVDVEAESEWAAEIEATVKARKAFPRCDVLRVHLREIV